MMRYYTTELWLKINDSDSAVRAEAEDEWKRNNLLYQKEFETTKKRLSHSFVAEFLRRGGLHDYTIQKIAVTSSGREYSCELELSDEIETIRIIADGLKAVSISAGSFKYCIQNKLTWGYSEFEITPTGSIRLCVLCDIENEIQLEFNSIKLTPIAQTQSGRRCRLFRRM